MSQKEQSILLEQIVNANYSKLKYRSLISEEIQQNIFKPFHQVEIESHKNYGGTGLGLSLAKAYVEFLHGKLTLKSEIDIGTTISVSIPLLILLIEPVKKAIREQKKNVSTILIAEMMQA